MDFFPLNFNCYAAASISDPNISMSERKMTNSEKLIGKKK